LAAAEKARSINDSLNSISTNDRIIKLKSEYEKDLTLAENAVLEARQAELDEKVSNQQLLLWLSSFFILSLLVLGLSLWRALSGKADAYRQLEKANETLSHKNNVLAQQEAELSAANQRMNRILAVLGHDLRAPLSSLSSLLEATSATEITRQELDYFLKELQKQTDESLNALESVLFWAQSQQKSGGKLKLESIELEPFFEEVIRTYTSGSRSKNIHLRTDITKELALMADRNMLRSMLGNLVSNAIKFTPAGGEISLSANKLDEKIQICVADSGKGMSESQLKQWNQSAAIKSNLGTAGERGTGIGLQLVTDFARLHHAELSFKANEPSGTKACLVFPVNHKQVATIK
jgi:signal transduction histidine kinase